MAKTLSATEFRRVCLRLLDHLPREGVVITKRGRPVARLGPVKRSPVELIGSIPDWVVDPNDDLFSTGAWDAKP